VAWHEVPGTTPPKEPSRRVRCDWCRCVARRFDDWSDEISNPKTENLTLSVGFAAPDHTVPYGTVLSRDAFPGTSCLATIMLSLRDKIHSASTKFLGNTLGRGPKSVLGNVQTPRPFGGGEPR
jgi:hypothetical protein